MDALNHHPALLTFYKQCMHTACRTHTLPPVLIYNAVNEHTLFKYSLAVHSSHCLMPDDHNTDHNTSQTTFLDSRLQSMSSCTVSAAAAQPVS